MEVFTRIIISLSTNNEDITKSILSVEKLELKQDEIPADELEEFDSWEEYTHYILNERANELEQSFSTVIAIRPEQKDELITKLKSIS